MTISLAALRTRLVRYARANPTIPQTIAAFAIKLFGAALSFAFSFLIAHRLGANGVGSYALALTTATVASTMALLGLDYILLRTLAGDLRVGDTAGGRGAVRTVIAAVTVAALVAAACLALFGAPLLQALLGKGLDAGLVRLAAVAVLPLALNRILAAALRGAGMVVTAQWFDGPQTMALTVGTMLVLTLWRTDIDVYHVLGLYTAMATASAIMAAGLYAHRARHWPAAAVIRLPPMLRSSWRIALVVLSGLVADWVILLLLGARFSAHEVGLFRTAWQIATVITLIVVTFDSVAGPQIAAAHRVGEHANIRKIWQHSVVIMALISLPLFVVILGFPCWVLGLFGPEFPVAATALRILALGQLINILTGPIGAVMIMTGQERWSLRLSAGSLAVLAGFGLTLIPAYGLIGAALTTSLTIACRNLAGYAILRKTLH